MHFSLVQTHFLSVVLKQKVHVLAPNYLRHHACTGPPVKIFAMTQGRPQTLQKIQTHSPITSEVSSVFLKEKVDWAATVLFYGREDVTLEPGGNTEEMKSQLKQRMSCVSLFPILSDIPSNIPKTDVSGVVV